MHNTARIELAPSAEILQLLYGGLVKVIDLPKPFYLLPAIPPELCQRVLAGIEKSSVVKGTVHDRYDEDPLANKQKLYYVHKNCYTFRTNVDVHAEFNEVAQRFTEDLTGLKLALIPSGTLWNMYTSDNQYFRSHTDNAYMSEGKLVITNPQRHLSTIIFLDEDYEGGLFTFDTLYEDGKQVSFKPKQGDMLVFPADVRFPHQVKPVTKGIRHTAVNWYSVL